MFRRIGYTVRQAFSQMGRNKGMNMTSVLAITAMMMILGIFFVAFLNVDLFANVIKKDYNIVEAYIQNGATEAEVSHIKDEIGDMDGVQKVEYRSKEDALKIMKDRWGDNAYLLDNLEENPLPDSYVAYVKNKAAADSVSKAAAKLKGVESVKYYRDTVAKLAKIMDFIRIASIVVMIFLIVVSTIIVANTIKLTVLNRAKEIEIMKYLGATDWFVRGPFLLEGIIIGFISSAIATGLMYLIYDRVIAMIGPDIARIISVPIIPSAYLIPNLGIIFASLGIGIGTCGSIISIRRFLRI